MCVFPLSVLIFLNLFFALRFGVNVYLFVMPCFLAFFIVYFVYDSYNNNNDNNNNKEQCRDLFFLFVRFCDRPNWQTQAVYQI